LDRLRVAIAGGAVSILARGAEEARLAARLAEGASGEARERCEPLDFAGGRAWFKRGPVRPGSALRRTLTLRALPRLRECRNLLWLREHGFDAPEPIAAGVLRRGGLPRFQFLLTRAIEGAETLEARGGAGLVDALAREVARMHAQGFVHHDLFPRNVLVSGPDSSRRFWFLDCWAGGPGPDLRGPAYDLACLLLRAEELLGAGGERRFLESYAEARPGELPGLARSVARHRKALLRRIASGTTRA